MTSLETNDVRPKHRGRHRYSPNGLFRLMSAIGLSLLLVAGFFSLWALDRSAQGAANDDLNAAESNAEDNDLSAYSLESPSIQDQDPSEPADDEDEDDEPTDQEPSDEPADNSDDSSQEDEDSSTSQLPSDVQAVIDATNAQRSNNDCSELSNDDSLTNAGMAHAKDMADHDYFSHTSQDGRSPTDRAAEHGYQGGVAENIAYGQPSAEAVVDAWMDSEGHRANILNCDYSVIGVGAVSNDAGTIYWVQKFGF